CMPGARAGSAACVSRSRRVAAKALMILHPFGLSLSKPAPSKEKEMAFDKLGPNGMGLAVSESHTDIVPDSEQRGLIGALPAAVRPYASLIRLDRPIGAWLLFWPGAWAVALAGMGERGWLLIAWLALGAWAMRSTGCVYNDIVA